MNKPTKRGPKVHRKVKSARFCFVRGANGWDDLADHPSYIPYGLGEPSYEIRMKFKFARAGSHNVVAHLAMGRIPKSIGDDAEMVNITTYVEPDDKKVYTAEVDVLSRNSSKKYPIEYEIFEYREYGEGKC